MHQSLVAKLAVLTGAAILVSNSAWAVVPVSSPRAKCAQIRAKSAGNYTKCRVDAERRQRSRRGICSVSLGACLADAECPSGETCDKPQAQFEFNQAVCARSFKTKWDKSEAKALIKGEPCPEIPTYEVAQAQADGDAEQLADMILDGILPPSNEPDGYKETHYIDLDGTDDYIALTGTGDVLDYTKTWSLGWEVENLAPNDGFYAVIARSGDNRITLRRSAGNWGIYFFAGSTSIGQANTFRVPDENSKMLFECDGSNVIYSYVSAGTQRTASMSINSTNIANNAPQPNVLEIGKGGGTVVGSTAQYWYGGISNLTLFSNVLGSIAQDEYFAASDVTQMSFYEDDVIDFMPLGEDPYALVLGLKLNVAGTMANGTPSDFVERP